MLQYVNNYHIKVMTYSAVPALAFVVIASWLTGRFVLSELWGMLVAVALVVAGTNIVGKRLMQKATDEGTRLVDLMADQCDPQALVDEGATIAGRMKAPLNEEAAWFASYYCLALDDIGRTEEAARYADMLRASMAAARRPEARAAICLHMEPAIRRLLGPETALAALNEAQKSLDAAGAPADDAHRRYIEWERSVLAAEADGDDEQLAELMRHVVETPSYQRRMRAEAAWERACALRRLGDADGEQESLRAAVREGNKLACASKARARLDELDRG